MMKLLEFYYWWTDEIKECRKKYLKARRKSERTRRSPEFEQLRKENRQQKKSVKLAIKTGKSRYFKETSNNADLDPWDRA
mgnify:CR=1 FL=1